MYIFDIGYFQISEYPAFKSATHETQVFASGICWNISAKSQIIADIAIPVIADLEIHSTPSKTSL